MPCRPKLCQRVAAQLSHQTSSSNGSHVWIPDDLLSEAFNRYVRVSHTSRRYGSHVPGPLEARRRSAKRRMGMAAVSVGGGMPPGGDFGALFGAGGGSTGWKWEAPGLNMREPPSPLPLERELALWDWQIRVPEVEVQPVLKTKVLNEDVDHVKESQVAFEKLLDQSAYSVLSDDQDFDPIFNFLVSSADETEAQNTVRFVRWLQGRHVTSITLRRLSDLIRDKLRLQTLPNDELLEVLKTLPRLVPWRTEDALAQQMHSMYARFWRCLDHDTTTGTSLCFPLLEILRPTARDADGNALVLAVLDHGITHAHANKANDLLRNNIPAILSAVASRDVGPEARAIVVSAVAQLLTKTKLKPRTLAKITQGYIDLNTDNARRKKVTVVWLLCLRECQLAELDVDRAYAVMAKHFQPCDLAKHFAALPTTDFARMLLRVWLPNVPIDVFVQDNWRHDHKGLDDQPLLDQLEFATRTLPSLAEDFEALIAERAENSDRESIHDHPLKWLVYVFARRDLHYDALIEAIINTCIAAYDPHRLHNTFSALWYCNSIRVKTSAIIPIVEHFLAIGETSRALSIVHRVPSITPESYPLIYAKLIKAGMFWKTRMFRALHRAPIWVPYRKRGVHKLTITESQVDAVHLMAHAYSSAGGSIRVAFRSVWACYRYLQDRGAQLSPLLSRALVHAGLTRPLHARVWIPDERLEFILRLVRRIEGEEVGHQVEDVAKQTRQGIHDQVLQKRRAEAGRLVERERMATLFRLKSWAKPKDDPERQVVSDASASPATDEPALEASGPVLGDLGHYKPFGSGEQDPTRLDDKT